MRVTEILSDLGVDFAEAGASQHVTEGWVGVVCPFCGRGTSNYGLGINLDSGHANCWKCGYHALVEVLEALTGESRARCKRLAKGLDKGFTRRLERPRGVLKAPPALRPVGAAALRYLKRRRLDPQEVVALWKLAEVGASRSKYAWRLFIPVSLEGEVVSFTTRAIGDSEPRYLMARDDESAVAPKQVLYGADLARGAVSVHEGPVDCWRVGPGACATLGVSYTRAQVCAIAKFPLRVVCFDRESGAQRRARKLCDELSALPGKTVLVVPSAKDIAVAPEREVKQLRNMLR